MVSRSSTLYDYAELAQAIAGALSSVSITLIFTVDSQWICWFFLIPGLILMRICTLLKRRSRALRQQEEAGR